MQAIVTGMIASYPVGGVLWDYGQYALGLERLGFEVFYLEDTGWQTYDPRQGEYGEDCSYSVEFLKSSLAGLSPALGERWRFRNMDGKAYGVSDSAFADVLRSADLFLGVPFNIACYALLTHMMAAQAGLGVGEFVWTGGDCHIYDNHREQVETLLARDPFPYPSLRLLRRAPSIFDYAFEDFEVVGYEHHPAIRAPVAV